MEGARSERASREAAPAFARLLKLAEERDSGPIVRVDALRWGHADLHALVPDGDARVRAVIERWGLRWPEGA
jgi:citrate lyase beta subunit